MKSKKFDTNKVRTNMCQLSPPKPIRIIRNGINCVSNNPSPSMSTQRDPITLENYFQSQMIKQPPNTTERSKRNNTATGSGTGRRIKHLLQRPGNSTVTITEELKLDAAKIYQPLNSQRHYNSDPIDEIKLSPTLTQSSEQASREVSPRAPTNNLDIAAASPF